jgi:hypothetical protein
MQFMAIASVHYNFPTGTPPAATVTFASVAPSTQDFTRTAETKWRHAIEKHNKDLAAIHTLELRLGIITRWVLGGPECEEAGRLVAMRKYQWSLDNLEGLVVAHIFQLTKMNRSQTGELPAVPLSIYTHLSF